MNRQVFAQTDGRQVENMASRFAQIDRIIESAYSYYNQADRIKEKDSSLLRIMFDQTDPVFARQEFAAVAAGFSVPVIAQLINSVITLPSILFPIIPISVFGISIGGFLYFVSKRRSRNEIVINAAVAKGNDLLQRNMDVLKYLPQDYWYPLATAHLAKMASQGRYDSYKEALADCDMYLHTCRTEDMNQEQLNILKQIEVNTFFNL